MHERVSHPWIELGVDVPVYLGDRIIPGKRDLAV
jgi:hypothetical protein